MDKKLPLDCEDLNTKNASQETNKNGALITEEHLDKLDQDKRTLITNEIVEAALKNDHGQGAILLDFNIKDFTKPGDNYSTLVTCVQCQVIRDGKEFTASYVVKLHKVLPMPGAEEMNAEFFLREAKFLTEIKSYLNKILTSCGEDNLYLPECVYHSNKSGKEIIIMKDLRERNFKMFDRQFGMKVEHATMVINGLARVHAAGFVYKEQNREKTLFSKFPYLIDKWIDNPAGKKQLEKFFSGLMVSGASLLENMEGYELTCEWLLKNKDNLVDMYRDLLYSGDERFSTICHGDIWNNNILFRYDEQNRPVEVILLDLQLCRVSSVATDLQYFTSASMDGDEKYKYLEIILHSYYTTLEGILRKCRVPVPFSFSELKEEFCRKQMYGLVILLTVLPLVMKSGADATDFSKLKEENMDDMIAEDRRINAVMMKNNLSFKSRVLYIFDECKRLGLFDKN